MADEATIRNAVYAACLARGDGGRTAFYDALRAEGIAPTPDDEPGHLYAPNPVVCPRSVVRTMVADLNRFCESRRDSLSSAADLLALAPPAVRDGFASPEVAAQIYSSIKRAHPWACLDAYLVDSDHGLEPAYLEWQTFPAYVGVGLKALTATRAVFPEIERLGASFLSTGDVSLEAFRERLSRRLTDGIDDPRTGVVVDFAPAMQETRREFYALQGLTGGPEHGFGVIDPREVRYLDGRPHYRRDGKMTPITAVISRLVAGDIERELRPALRGDDREDVLRFFCDGASIKWIVHPLHFTYGSKRDFPEFYARGLAEGLSPCEFVTEDRIARARANGDRALTGWVQKPIDGHGGQDVVGDPPIDLLRPGALLQRVIHPAACHQTLAGPRVPEIRVMGIPGADGRLESPIVFTRVKAPDVFRSNAGVTARANVAGTGEGYAVIAG